MMNSGANVSDTMVILSLIHIWPRHDLPEGYAPREVASVLNGMAARITAVRCNCDAEVDQMVLDFPCLADYALVAVSYTHLDVYKRQRPRRTTW